MRVVARLTERIGHPLDQLLRNRVLQPLGFDVHVTPVVAELAVRYDSRMR